MKRRIFKIFTAWQYEKEEKWLNEMSEKGYQLADVGFCNYGFIDGTPGKYIYRLELLEYTPPSPQSQKYLDFLEGTGVEHVDSLFRWVYLRKPAADGAFELFSDCSSIIKHLTRMIQLILPLLIMNALLLFMNITNTLPNVPDGSISPWILFCLQIFVVVLLGFGVLYLYRKIRLLKKESLLRE